MILLFDVNATLLDLQPMQPHFERWFGDKRVMREWFGQMLRHSLVATITRAYQPFDVLGRDALNMTARRHGVELSTNDVDVIVGQMLQLPPHPDVIPALTRLKEAKCRLFTLTNSPPHALAAQLDYANITGFFEQQFTVDPVRLFKPAPETYHYAADQLGVHISETRLIAAHDWDVTGAIRAGAKAAFVARPQMLLGESSETPDIVGPDLSVVVDHLLE